jgi:hypothetical protein
MGMFFIFSIIDGSLSTWALFIQRVPLLSLLTVWALGRSTGAFGTFPALASVVSYGVLPLGFFLFNAARECF